jgi:hypothetical protein
MRCFPGRRFLVVFGSVLSRRFHGEELGSDEWGLLKAGTADGKSGGAMMRMRDVDGRFSWCCGPAPSVLTALKRKRNRRSRSIAPANHRAGTLGRPSIRTAAFTAPDTSSSLPLHSIPSAYQNECRPLVAAAGNRPPRSYLQTCPPAEFRKLRSLIIELEPAAQLDPDSVCDRDSGMFDSEQLAG